MFQSTIPLSKINLDTDSTSNHRNFPLLQFYVRLRFKATKISSHFRATHRTVVFVPVTANDFIFAADWG